MNGQMAGASGGVEPTNTAPKESAAAIGSDVSLVDNAKRLAEAEVISDRTKQVLDAAFAVRKADTFLPTPSKLSPTPRRLSFGLSVLDATQRLEQLEVSSPPASRRTSLDSAASIHDSYRASRRTSMDSMSSFHSSYTAYTDASTGSSQNYDEDDKKRRSINNKGSTVDKSSKKKKTSKTNRSGTSNRPSATKSKRPLSAYNLFFRHQRALIIMDENEKKSDDSNRIIGDGVPINRPPDQSPEEHRTSVESILAKVSEQKKNGMKSKFITFVDLVKLITKRWKYADEETRALFEDLAAKEKVQFQRDVNTFMEFQPPCPPPMQQQQPEQPQQTLHRREQQQPQQQEHHTAKYSHRAFTEKEEDHVCTSRNAVPPTEKKFDVDEDELLAQILQGEEEDDFFFSSEELAKDKSWEDDFMQAIGVDNTELNKPIARQA